MENVKTTFELFNSTDSEMHIIHEPETFDFFLPTAESVIIEVEKNCKNSISIQLAAKDGIITASIWSDESDYKIFYKDEDVFKNYLE